MLVRNFAWMGAVLALVAMAGPGCGDEETKVVTPEPAIGVSLVATPAGLDTGGRAAVKAVLDTHLAGPFTFRWNATGGRFVNADAESTIWVAPEDPGLYSLAVMITDGRNSGFAARDVGVGAYVPADDPFYRGAAYCALCHGGDGEEDEEDYYHAWAASGHAGAFETLRDIGMHDNAYCVGCHTVGTNGLIEQADLDNGGYDERAVSFLEGVQCENCHGPGSAHPDGGMSKLPSDRSAELCKQCHEGEHHPTYTEWARSLHGSALIAYPAMQGGNSQCFKCHNGLYAMDYLDDPAGYANTAAPTDSMRITCVVCHEPHGNANPSNLRAAVNDVALPGGLHPAIGAGRLCIACHNGRRAPGNIDTQIANGNANFGPHHSNQGDMLAGTNAYEGVAPGFPFATSNHVLIQDGCVSCHNHQVPFAEGAQAYTGHEFTPTVQACAPCHGPIDSTEGIIAKADYDADGSIEAVQKEVEGLIAMLEQTIIAATPADSLADRQALEDGLAGGTFPAAVGNANNTTVEQRKAGYNLFFVEFDHSRGVHNAVYAIQLLQQSILSLDPGALPRSAVLRKAG